MLDFLRLDLVPGRLFVLATLLPLLPVVLLLLTALVRNLCRSSRETVGLASRIYWLLGGDQPLPLGGYVSLISLVISAGLGIWGAQRYFEDLQQFPADSLAMESRWSERVDWLRIGSNPSDFHPGHTLELGYRIDRLSVLMFVMVTVVGSLIFLFSFGYMKDELNEKVEIGHHGEGHRRGRFSRFYLYLSLFAFSMLNLLIADNLLQVFISWELVGVCSFFLIGFYYERRSACIAANKAFIMNRVGDAGFLVGIAIAWGSLGTLNLQELGWQLEPGVSVGFSQELWVLMGFGLFLGCIGKSAQLPLQTWLPDAMEGPTPVSALIHAATMVAAGVYFLARIYPLLSPLVLLGVAYVGFITLVLSALCALVSTDIKRVLAFSTCSQLGYMFLALGVGAWSAALLHLLTHACFKALLFLGAGSVIHGLHHEQDLRQMGGLRRKMPITAYTMLVGVLAISGLPLLSGWYSKDQILSGCLGFAVANHQLLIFVVPLLTAGFTAYYMFRLWFLTFAGTPRNQHLHDHAHESPLVMTLPLMILALISVGVAWGWPVWDAEASALGLILKAGTLKTHLQLVHVHEETEHYHLLAGGLALLVGLIGGLVAWNRFARRAPSAASLAEPQGILAERWYFDALYDLLFVRGTLLMARGSAHADRHMPDSPRKSPSLDGILNSVSHGAVKLGSLLRTTQSGRVRLYVLTLIVTMVTSLGLVILFKS